MAPKLFRKGREVSKLDTGDGSIKEEVEERNAALSAWDTLPEPLLQQILAHVLSGEPGWLGRKVIGWFRRALPLAFSASAVPNRTPSGESGTGKRSVWPSDGVASPEHRSTEAVGQHLCCLRPRSNLFQ